MLQADRFATAVVAALIALVLSGPAAAQGSGAADLPRAEVWGAWSAAVPITGGTLASSYEPPMRLGGTPLESRAQQVLSVDAGVGHGVDVGVNVFFNRVFGVQGAFTATSAAVSGTNGNYSTFLRYIALQPPDYQPREYTYEQTTPWDPTSGTIGYRSLAVGGVLRWRAAAGRVGGTVAGGLSIDWFAGELESLGYSQFILGGHATLFPVTHRIIVGPARSEYTFGPYVGGDVQVAVGDRFAVVGGVRVGLESGLTVPIQVVDLVDPDENPWAPEVPEVAASLAGQPLELPGRRWRTLVGVKFFLR